MADALLWIVGILVVGYIAWNWLVVPGMFNALNNINSAVNRNPKLKADLQRVGNDLKKPQPVTPHHPANYGYYYY